MGRYTDLDIAKRLVRTEHSARDRGLDFDLTFNKLKRILNTKKCFYTGVELEHEDVSSPYYLTLDRVDSSKGYIDQNLVACSRIFNQRKGDLSPEEVTQLYVGYKKKGLI